MSRKNYLAALTVCVPTLILGDMTIDQIRQIIFQNLQKQIDELTLSKHELERAITELEELKKKFMPQAEASAIVFKTEIL